MILLLNLYNFTQDYLQSLQTTFEEYDAVCEKLIREFGTARNEYREDDRLLSLKDKFVQLNNVSNWTAEMLFDNPNARVYKFIVKKIQENNRLKRQKLDSHGK